MPNPLLFERKLHLDSLDTAIRLSILAETVMLSGLVVAAGGSRGSRGGGRRGGFAGARSLAALLAGLMGVDLAVRELAGKVVR